MVRWMEDICLQNMGGLQEESFEMRRNYREIYKPASGLSE